MQHKILIWYSTEVQVAYQKCHHLQTQQGNYQEDIRNLFWGIRTIETGYNTHQCHQKCAKKKMYVWKESKEDCFEAVIC